MAPTPELTFLRKGNSVVDEVAKMASSSLLPDFLSSWDSAYEATKIFTRMLLQQYNMRYEMSMLRVQLDSQQSAKPRKDTCDLHWFCHYTVEEPQTFHPPEEAFQHIHASNWGTTFSGLLLDWLTTLMWPRTEPSKTSAVGITWFELAVNFQVVSQQTIPVNVQLPNGKKEHRWQFEDPELDTSQFAYSDLIFSLQGCVKHLQWLLQMDLIPTNKTQKVRSLYLLGGNVFRMGFASRPQMHYQTETMKCVQEYLNQHASGRLNFEQHPKIPQVRSLLELRFFSSSWWYSGKEVSKVQCEKERYSSQPCLICGADASLKTYVQKVFSVCFDHIFQLFSPGDEPVHSWQLQGVRPDDRKCGPLIQVQNYRLKGSNSVLWSFKGWIHSPTRLHMKSFPQSASGSVETFQVWSRCFQRRVRLAWKTTTPSWYLYISMVFGRTCFTIASKGRSLDARKRWEEAKQRRGVRKKGYALWTIPRLQLCPCWQALCALPFVSGEERRRKTVLLAARS